MFLRRHAAAIALIGWYLIVPQLYDGHLIGPLLDRPGHSPDLAHWNNDGSYDTAAECEAARSQLVLVDPNNPRFQLDADTLATLRRFATCVSTDDPRLKENP